MGQENRPDAVADEARPATLTWALRLLGLLVAFGGIIVLFMVLRQDDLLRAWAEGNEAARRILETEGLDALKHAPEGKIEPPHFIAPAITLYGTVALTLWVLGVFLASGFEWGRVCITALLVVVAISSIGGLLTEPPFALVVATIAAIVLGVAALVLMWLPPTTAYIHPRRAPAADLS